MTKVSASQIKTWRRCERCWAFPIIDRVPRSPSTPAQQFGTDGHTHAAAYLDRGTLPPNTPEGQAFAKGLKKKNFLPEPGTGLKSEYQFSLHPDELPGIKLWGYIDWVGQPAGETPLVVDHKFTKQRKYAVKVDDLRSDPQALIYGVWAMLYFGTPEVRVRLCYYVANKKKEDAHRKPRSAFPVEVTLRADDPQLRKDWAVLAQDCRDIVAARKNTKRANDLKPNTKACDDYGGCDFRGICELSDGDKIAGRLLS